MKMAAFEESELHSARSTNAGASIGIVRE